MKMLLLALTAVALTGGCVIPLDKPPADKPAERSSPWSLKDPVCGVTCIGDKCERETMQDKQFMFCSKECKKKFDENPEKYLPEH